MKIKCRILSMCIVIVLAIALISGIIIIVNKDKNKEIYAESLKFSGLIGGAEIYIDNEFLIEDNLVTVSPSNCSFAPEFIIKKSGDDQSVAITKGKISFPTVGKYILSCKIKSSKDYYLTRSIVINVVANPTSNTSMYIKDLRDITLYVEECVDLCSVVEMNYPNSCTVEMICNENISVENNILTALKDGLGKIDIMLNYENVIICKTIYIRVKPKITENDIELKLSVGGQILDSDELEIEYSEFNFIINYGLTLLEDNQLVNCWTDSDIISIVSYNPPIIEFQMLAKGEAIIYVSPINYPDVEFEIVINII